jgi:hypothetical protein
VDDAGRPRSNARNAQLRSSITLVGGNGENSDGAQFASSLSIDAALVAEAEHEVAAARQNLAEAIKAWERAIHGIHPATLLLASAQRRLDKAHGLLRAARGGTDNGVTKEEITPAADEEPSVS